MSSESFLRPSPGPRADLRDTRPRRDSRRSKSNFVVSHPECWCEAVITGHGAIMGYRIRDRAGRFFGFGRDSHAAWEDAWQRMQDPESHGRISTGAYPFADQGLRGIRWRASRQREKLRSVPSGLDLRKRGATYSMSHSGAPSSVRPFPLTKGRGVRLCVTSAMQTSGPIWNSSNCTSICSVGTASKKPRDCLVGI